jgi:hypothetical protein
MFAPAALTEAAMDSIRARSSATGGNHRQVSATDFHPRDIHHARLRMGLFVGQLVRRQQGSSAPGIARSESGLTFDSSPISPIIVVGLKWALNPSLHALHHVANWPSEASDRDDVRRQVPASGTGAKNGRNRVPYLTTLGRKPSRAGDRPRLSFPAQRVNLDLLGIRFMPKRLP